MKIEIPFDENTYLDQTKLIVPLVYSNLLNKLKINLGVGLILIPLGFYLINNLHYDWVILIVIGVFFLYASYRNYITYIKVESSFLKESKRFLDANENKYLPGFFEFTDQFLLFKQGEFESKTPWATFKDYRVVKQNLLLIKNPIEGDILVIGKEEIGANDFKKVVHFVNQKIRSK